MSSENLVYLYNPSYEGAVSSYLAEQTNERLLEHGVDVSRVVEITDASYLRRKLDKGCLVIPGGHTFLLAASLESAVVKIKEHVKKGILNYLGFCSGGNFACSRLKMKHVSYDEDLLGLVPYSAIWRSEVGIVSLYMEEEREPFHVYANNGSSYEIPDNPFIFQRTLASYENGTVAANLTFCGGGNVVRSGVHPEVPFEGFIEAFETEFETDSQLQKNCHLIDNDGRKELLRSLFQSAQINGT